MSFILLLILSLLIINLPGCSGGFATKGWSGFAASNGTVFVGGTDGNLNAIRLSDRNVIWSKQLETLPSAGFFSPASFAAIYSTPAVDGNHVFAGSYMLTGSDEHGHVFGFNSTDGELTWIFPARGSLNGAIIGNIAAAGGLVYAGATDHKLYALDGSNGEKKWEFTSGDQIWAGPVVSGNTLYVGSFDKKMYALDAATGAEKWHYETEGAIVSAVLVYKNTIYFGTYNRHFYALDAATGNLKWDFTTGGGFWATPVAVGDVFFVPCLDGYVYVLDPANGREIAKSKLNQYISSSPAVVGNTAIIASQDGNIYSFAVNSTESSLINELKATVQGPLFSLDGIIYIHTSPPSSDYVYAIDTSGKQIWNPPLPLKK